MAINKLTHPVLRAAKPHEKPYKLGDGGWPVLAGYSERRIVVAAQVPI